MENFYKNIKIINNPNDIDVLVNKQYKLPVNYTPNDLELINANFSEDEKFLRRIAKYHFEKMCIDAQNENIHIIAVSTFRSYEYQEKLYNNYVLEKGLEYANMCCAKSGHSEHQTGLAVDISDKSGDYDNFNDTKEFIWVKNNAHKYGFILRYPKNKTNITGFKYEPWHYRYVGEKIAKYIYDNNITFEEYKKISDNINHNQ